MESIPQSQAFIEKNIIGVLQRSQGTVRYTDISRLLHSWTFKQDFLNAYASLLMDGTIRDYLVASTKRKNTNVRMVTLVKEQPAYAVQPLKVLKREQEEAPFVQAGRDAYFAGIKRHQHHRIGRPYCAHWRRIRSAWQTGWDAAQDEDIEEKTGKPVYRRYVVNPLGGIK